jgi:hypothetical protein
MLRSKIMTKKMVTLQTYIKNFQKKTINNDAY